MLVAQPVACGHQANPVGKLRKSLAPTADCQLAVSVTRAQSESAFHGRLEFLQNDVEILSIHGDIATEQILFSMKGTPKKAAAPFLFKGRNAHLGPL
jgi:hypothetical protein